MLKIEEEDRKTGNNVSYTFAQLCQRIKLKRMEMKKESVSDEESFTERQGREKLSVY